MKPGMRVVLVVPGSRRAYLGTLNQPVIDGTERRWSVDWADGTADGGTWPKEWLHEVSPQ